MVKWLPIKFSNISLVTDYQFSQQLLIQLLITKSFIKYQIRYKLIDYWFGYQF